MKVCFPRSVYFAGKSENTNFIMCAKAVMRKLISAVITSAVPVAGHRKSAWEKRNFVMTV